MAHWELYMSKKNNKKFNKKNHRKNYKIESLEPRLLMDAAPNANDWIKEADSSVNQFGDYNISASGSKMEGLLVYEQGTSSEPEALALAVTTTRTLFTVSIPGTRTW